MTKLLPLFFFTLTFIIGKIYPASAQEISGTWIGNYQKNLLTTQPLQLVVELSVYNDSIVTGLSHLYYNRNKYEHYRVRGKFNRKDSTIYFKEDSTIAVYLGTMSSNCLGNYTMKLYYTDSSMVLTGKWKDNDRSFLHCPTTGVFLVKKLPPKLKQVSAEKEEVLSRPDKDKNEQEAVSVTNTIPESVTQREPEIQKLLEYDVYEKDSVLISIYDNGEIDGDSVSVYFDGRPILMKSRISDKPLQFYVNLDPAQLTHRLVMVGESMGSIPPCTALMIVKTRKNRYEMNLSSNFTKNAVLEFFFKQ
ncbi:MAG: hypothetical protein IT254_06575 [Chitinophagaceae bacterium]|nr:hypothetical protein [Bacteroidota bacterium]MCC6257966.1 hypothetical protein [Chitinophagaceae bacterium]